MSTDTTRETEWRAWKEEIFGTEYMIWHDGLYTGAVTGLQGPARAKALEMLRLGVSLGDAHAAEALAAMGEADDAPAMRAQLAGAYGSSRVRLALAIHEVTPDPTLAAELVAVLHGCPAWTDRIDAAMGLRHFGGPDDEAALLASVERDPEYLVRYHAAESLLRRWAVVPSEITKHEAIFRDLCGPTEGPPTPENYERFAQARAALEALRAPAG